MDPLQDETPPPEPRWEPPAHPGYGSPRRSGSGDFSSGFFGTLLVAGLIGLFLLVAVIVGLSRGEDSDEYEEEYDGRGVVSLEPAAV